MKAILINNLARIWQQKQRVFIMFLMIFCGIALALYLGKSGQATLKIAAVGFQSEEIGVKNEKLQVTYLTKAPSKVDLIEGIYDAIIEKEETGGIKINSIKSDKFEAELKQALMNKATKVSAGTDTRKIDEKVFGYLMMFFMMSCISSTFLFAEEKEKDILPRIMVTNTSLVKLLSSHTLFILFLLTIPTVLMIQVLGLLFHISFAVSIIAWLGMLGLLAALTISLGVMLVAYMAEGDSANMMGTMIVTATSLLSGSFFVLETKQKTLQAIIDWLPQKKLMVVFEGLGSQNFWQNNFWSIVYVLGLSLAFFVLACLQAKKTNLLQS